MTGLELGWQLNPANTSTEQNLVSNGLRKLTELYSYMEHEEVADLE